MHPSSRVVITGMGLVTPLGCGVEVVWQRLLGGSSGLQRLPDEFCAGLEAQVGARVPSLADDAEAGLDIDRVVPAKDRKKMDRFIVLALAAAEQALAQAGWHPNDAHAQERTATVIASGIGGFPAIADAVRTTDQRGPRRLSPFTVPSFLANMAAGHVSIRHGFKGPIGAPVTACAASVQALGDGARLIRSGEADVAVCGGTEATIHLVTQAGFAAARALSTGYSDHPSQASRPFDGARDGFIVGEGAGVLVLESLEHALQRGATPLAELVGYGTSADAHHVTSGPEDGSGAARAMQLALRQAGLQASQVQHVNAHATSTQVGDAAELAAFRTVFAGASPAISATKSATGHLLGAAGAVEAIFTILALRDQIAPPTLNLHTPDPLAEGLDLVRLTARPMAMDYALSNGFGFGGVNASVVLKRWAEGA
ncbi:beta-ketoacyl-ACP synthase II [Rhodoferax saidenbachensis]|uniref:3-oxoacyl-[acyl-carrier-protein] synthase 2 n=1 Tax=Rhodoferax saidenbachensis TaxID=1484693 RepID=A0ABU1ZP15_9BURK|nr:beta-ketoacyl-ACP synthase II [Rhodoferax saidenbachensis]MDR7307294.1 3-oxoacyl-[acyl-carrier-protein] synthase II [Rhodoferax saidenbachensis]